jgi:hypothetical protein
MVIGLLMVLPAGCAVTGGVPGSGVYGDVSVGLDYYEPDGVVYGEWGPGYRVGPVGDRGQRADRGGGRPAQHAYRPAPASHPTPSIPSRPRQGGSRRH